MKITTIGQSGVAVSQIGLGTVKFGRNQCVKYPKPFELPSDQQIRTLLEAAKQLGINLLDTAPAYGVSEERLGQLLKGERHHWVISTKVGEEYVNGQSHFDFSKAAIEKSIERSLTRLQTDVLDIVLVHSDGQDVKRICDDEVFVTLEKLKQAGKIRCFGMSTKTIDGGKLALDHADIAMVTYNLNEQAEKAVLDYAAQQQKAIFVKKALASGYLPANEAIAFVLKEPSVTSVVIGTLNPAHLTPC